MIPYCHINITLSIIAFVYSCFSVLMVVISISAFWSTRSHNIRSWLEKSKKVLSHNASSWKVFCDKFMCQNRLNILLSCHNGDRIIFGFERGTINNILCYSKNYIHPYSAYNHKSRLHFAISNTRKWLKNNTKRHRFLDP